MNGVLSLGSCVGCTEMIGQRGMVSCADFESAAKELQNLAHSADRRGALANIASGACDGSTLSRNREAFREWALVPRVLVDVSSVCTSTTILGHTVAQPFGVAPTAYQLLVHDDGESGMARASATCRIPYCMSSSATTALEDVAVAAGSGLRFMQVYAMVDKTVTQRLVVRAERAGFSAFVLTVDRPVLGKREAADRWGFDNRSAIAKDPNRLAQAGSGAGGPPALYNASISAALTWADVAWLRSITRLPVVLKGILSPADAALAVQAGAAAVWVSNHGGRQLDGAIASLDALPACVAAVRAAESVLPPTPGPGFPRRRVEVWVDGGVRRGTDVLKALALGADFVFLGRPPLWGLAVGGEAGVRRLLELLAAEVRTGMQLLGVVRVEDITGAHIARRGPLPLPGQAGSPGIAQASLGIGGAGLPLPRL